MISADEFYNHYYTNLPIDKKYDRDDEVRLFVSILDNGELVFGCNFIGRYTFYFFKMTSPEVYAISCDPPYIPLSISDMDTLMHILSECSMWKEIVNTMNQWIENPEEGCENFYSKDSIHIPTNPPDYRLIFENGYTGKESLDFVNSDYY